MRACLICSASALWSLLNLLYTARAPPRIHNGRICPWGRIHRTTLHSQSIQQWAYQSLRRWISGLAGHQKLCRPSYILNSLKNEEREKKPTEQHRKERPRGNPWLELSYSLKPPPGDTVSNSLPYYSLTTLSSIVLSIPRVQRVTFYCQNEIFLKYNFGKHTAPRFLWGRGKGVVLR